jgi:hypothetical protein
MHSETVGLKPVLHLSDPDTAIRRDNGPVKRIEGRSCVIIVLIILDDLTGLPVKPVETYLYNLINGSIFFLVFMLQLKKRVDRLTIRIRDVLDEKPRGFYNNDLYIERKKILVLGLRYRDVIRPYGVYPGVVPYQAARQINVPINLDMTPDKPVLGGRLVPGINPYLRKSNVLQIR